MDGRNDRGDGHHVEIPPEAGLEAAEPAPDPASEHVALTRTQLRRLLKREADYSG